MSITIEKYIEAATKKGWAYDWIDEKRNFAIFYPPNEEPIIIRNNVTELGSAIGLVIATYKTVAATLAQKIGFNVPETMVIEDEDSYSKALPLLEREGRLVVKPMDGAFGEGVFTNVRSKEQLERSVTTARDNNVKSRAVIVQKYCEGKDYRLFVLDGKVVAAIERIPFRITGDGHSTIEQLIKSRLGSLQSRDENLDNPIKLTYEESRQFLNQAGHKTEDIVPADQVLDAWGGANLSQGGEARDVINALNPLLSEMAVRLAELCKLTLCAVDILAPDVSSQPGSSTFFIEINHAPGFKGHYFPSDGNGTDLASLILDTILIKRAPKPH